MVEETCSGDFEELGGLSRWNGQFDEWRLIEARTGYGRAVLLLLPLAWLLSDQRAGSGVREKASLFDGLSLGGSSRVGMRQVVLPRLERLVDRNPTLDEAIGELVALTVTQHTQIALSRLAQEPWRDVALLRMEGDRWIGLRDYAPGRTASRLREAIGWLYQLKLVSDSGLTDEGETILRSRPRQPQGDDTAMNPRGFLREPGYPIALLATYSFDPYFFERLVLPDLWAGSSNSVLVLVDQGELRVALNAHLGNLRHLGRRYFLQPVEWRGAFHPKIFLRLGDEGGLAWVGSNNLTRGGWGGNSELGSAWRLDRDRLDGCGWLTGLLGYLDSLTTGLAKDLLYKALRLTWLEGIPAEGRHDVLISHEEPIGVQIRKAVG